MGEAIGPVSKESLVEILPQEQMFGIESENLQSSIDLWKKVSTVVLSKARCSSLWAVVVLLFVCSGCGRIQTPVKKRYPSKDAYAGFLSSTLWQLRGKPDKALQDALNAVRQDPESAYLRVSAARLLLQMERYEDARRMLKQAKKRRPDLPDIYLVSALVDMMSGEMSSAKKFLQKALKKAPDWKEVYWVKARYHQVTGGRKYEINVYEKLLKLDVDDAAALMALGSLKRRMGKHAKGKKYLEKLIRRFPWYGRAYLESAYLKHATGNRAAAEKYLKKALEMDDDDISTARVLWSFYLYHGKKSQAFDFLNGMKSHGSPSYWAFIAEKHLEHGFFKEARDLISQAREMDSRSEEVFLVEIEMMILEGNFEQAEKLAMEAFEDERKQSGAISALVNIYLRWGECERGLKKLRSMDMEETLGRLTSLAYIEAECGERGSLRRKFENKVKSKGLEEEALYRSALVLEAAGSHEEAVEKAKKMLSVSPGNYLALNLIGYIYANQQINLSTGIGLMRQAIAFRPFDPMLMDSLAWIHFKNGDIRRAKKYIDKALKIMPNEPEILYHAGRIEENKGMVESAIEKYKAALKKKPFPRIKKAVEKRLEVLVKK